MPLYLCLPGCRLITEHGGFGGSVQPAIVRAQARAFALSVTPGNRRRSSMAADNFALLIEDGADRGGLGLGDDEHLNSMGRRTTAGKHDMRRALSASATS